MQRAAGREEAVLCQPASHPYQFEHPLLHWQHRPSWLHWPKVELTHRVIDPVKSALDKCERARPWGRSDTHPRDMNGYVTWQREECDADVTVSHYSDIAWHRVKAVTYNKSDTWKALIVRVQYVVWRCTVNEVTDLLIFCILTTSRSWSYYS